MPTPRLRPVALALTTILVTGVFVTAQASKLGAGVTDRQATPISDLYQSPEKFVGQTVRLDGVVTAVCESMGCWMALADAADTEKVVRLKVDHGAGIVFPIAAKGKPASAEGVFERIADPKNESPYKDDFAVLDHVEVKDKYNGTIILKEYFAPLWTSTLPEGSGKIVCKAAVDHALKGDVTKVARYQARFAGVFFPGETMVTSIWREGSQLLVASKSKERGTPVLSNAALTLRS